MNSPHPTLQRFVRRARRLPGYRRVRRSALQRLRRNALLKDLVSRIYSGNEAQKRWIPRTYPPPGNVLSGLGTENLPVAVVSLVSVPEERIDVIVDEIAALQLMSAAFRPLFLMDCGHFEAVRRYGYAAELLIPASQWQFSDMRWEDYAVKRVADLRRRYGATISVAVSAEGITDPIRFLLEAGSSE